jgi:hypothetical protein
VIAHETTHALLDGLHPRFSEGSNEDMLALHEAFADIVALFQHFSYPEVLRDQIARTRGDLESENLLGQLAQEFGLALGRGGALRDALGARSDDGIWRRHRPDRTLIHRRKGPHGRGAVLVAAAFQAFVNIYRARTADMFRIATNGTGVLPPGAIHPDLVNRLANEAAKTARHILQMCIRALDYCPPVDVTLGDYLRAIITADHDLFPEDERDYRVAVLEAFIAWGIVPEGMRSYSPITLLWPTLAELVADETDDMVGMKADLETDFGLLVSDPLRIRRALKRRPDVMTDINAALDGHADRISELMNMEMADRIVQQQEKDGQEEGLSRLQSKYEFDRTGRYDHESVLSQNLLGLGLGANREIEWHAQQFYCLLFWGLLTDPDRSRLLQSIGLCVDQAAPPSVFRSSVTNLPAIEVHSVRMASRRGVRDQVEREYVVEVMQRRRGYLDPDEQRRKDGMPALPQEERGDFRFRRGCTLLIDARTFRIRRVIRTLGNVADNRELERMRGFLANRWRSPTNAFDDRGVRSARESFAHLHRHVEED